SASFLLLHHFVKPRFVHSQPTLTRHQFGEVERKPLFIIKLERECARDPGSAPAPGAVSRALAGNLRRAACNRRVRSPKPAISLRQGSSSVIPGISADVMKLLLQIRISTNQAIKRLFFPHMNTGDTRSFVD